MTHELYSKATDLRVEIQHLRDIRDVLINSKGRELIAYKSRISDSLLLETVDIVNSVHIMDEPILKKLIKVVDDEIDILEDDFRKL